jgi:hypothetical protein
VDNVHARYSTVFITENLYACAYFCIAAKNLDAAGKVIARLQKYKKEDFTPQHYALGRLIEIIHTIESKDWPNTIRLIKNAKRSTVDELPGLYDLLLFLDREAKRIVNSIDAKSIKPFTNAPQDLLESLEGQQLLSYFNLSVWLQSRLEDRPMMDIFYQRANPASEESQPIDNHHID